MAAIVLKEARKAVHDRIKSFRDAGKYAINGFEIEETYFPFQKLTDVPPAGKVWVIGLASDDVPFSRANSYTKEIPIQVGLQKLISDPRKTAEIDSYITLEQQLRETVFGMDDQRFTLLRIESLKDQNDTPFAFMGLREQHTFEAYFTAFFSTQLASGDLIS